MIDGVIFDMDGLMFDTERVWATLWEPALATLGLSYKEGLDVAARGTAGDSMRAVLRRFYGENCDTDAIIAALLLTSLNRKSRLSPSRAVDALEQAAKLALPVASSCASVGIMVAMTGATGLGMVLGDGLIAAANGNFYVTLVFTMITCIILGMGLPTSACYIVVSTIAAPALLKFGVSGLPVHMFAFYFGILSVLTPPVCTASLTAAGIAGAQPSKVGYKAFSMAAAGFIVPYIFMMTPQLLMVDTTLTDLLTKIPSAVLGTACVAAAVAGYIRTSRSLPERAAAFAAGLCLMDGGLTTDAAGVLLIGAVVVMNVMQAASERKKDGNGNEQSQNRI